MNVESMPDAISWIHYLSVFYYAFEAMVTNEINGLIFTFQARWLEAGLGLRWEGWVGRARLGLSG